MSIKIKFGNHKLGDDTAIFNMCSAEDCPSKKLNLCTVINKGITCYADKAERTYKHVKPYRRCQQTYWQAESAPTIIRDIGRAIANRRKPTRFFRFNESGDFGSQEDINKLSTIAEGLKVYGITTYGYTARRDLSFSGVHFYFKSSGWISETGTGSTIVIHSKSELPKSNNLETWILCPGSCKTCDICRKNIKINIAFLKH
jgi:hypothetical protein